MLKRRLTDSMTMLIVCGLSLFLVVYVGFGEAQRTFTQFHVEKLHAQGQILQTAMSGYLRAGLLLVGFDGIPEARRAVAAGRIDATVAQRPGEMGREAVRSAVRFFRDERLPRGIPVALELIGR